LKKAEKAVVLKGLEKTVVLKGLEKTVVLKGRGFSRAINAQLSMRL
jgi:hypothetical protein